VDQEKNGTMIHTQKKSVQVAMTLMFRSSMILTSLLRKEVVVVLSSQILQLMV